jgi:hypothetical protein
MTLTAATILLYLVALFLAVATFWFFSYTTQTISPKESDPQFFWVLIIVVIPFVILVYFGLAFILSDKISEETGWLTAMPSAPTFTQRLAAAVACRFIRVAMVALAQSDSAVYEDTRPGSNNCDGDYPHNCWWYLGRTPRPNILSGFALIK